MKDLGIVITYTIKEMLKKKTFWVSNIIILLFIIVGFNIPNILNSFDSEEKTPTISKVLVVDSNNVYEGMLSKLNQMNLGYEFEIAKENLAFEQIKEKIEKAEIEEALVISKQDKNIKVQYIVRDMAMMQQIPENYSNALSTLYTDVQLAKLGLTVEQTNNLKPSLEFEVRQTEEKEVKGNVFVIMLLSLVLFYAIYFCAYQVSSSITTEKTSKIMETLVTSTKPRTIVLGKTIGIGIVGFLQVAVIIGVALICAKSALPEGILESVLDMSQITPTLGILTVIYFILGYSTFALLYALTGSTVSKPEDVQTANGPVAIVAVVGFYLSYFTMMNPNSDLNVFASIFPFSSPFCMPFRIMMGIASPSQIAISIAVLLATILVIANISIKIYSNAILNYGSRVSLKDMIKMYQNKDDNNS